METASKTLGILGEELASHYVRKRGYKLLVRNYRCPLGEIDLVARDRNTLVFIEVKTRRSLERGLPTESITSHKRAQITRCAQYYLKQYAVSEVPCRFDAVSVILSPEKEPDIELIRDAFREGL